MTLKQLQVTEDTQSPTFTDTSFDPNFAQLIIVQDGYIEEVCDSQVTITEKLLALHWEGNHGDLAELLDEMWWRLRSIIIYHKIKMAIAQRRQQII